MPKNLFYGVILCTEDLKFAIRHFSPTMFCATWHVHVYITDKDQQNSLHDVSNNKLMVCVKYNI